MLFLCLNIEVGFVFLPFFKCFFKFFHEPCEFSVIGFLIIEHSLLLRLCMSFFCFGPYFLFTLMLTLAPALKNFCGLCPQATRSADECPW